MPFDDAERDYLVLMNDGGEHSLWPAFAEVPDGWAAVFAAGRDACLDHIRSSWTGLTQ